LTQSVDRAATSTSVTSAQSSLPFGTLAAVTATVTSDGGAPTGSVTFSAGSSVVGTLPLVGGQAVLDLIGLPAGSQSITATYSGDSNFLGTSSTPLPLLVVRATSTTSLNTAVNPTSAGAPITL